jgi:hypothetical protein
VGGKESSNREIETRRKEDCRQKGGVAEGGEEGSDEEEVSGYG